MTNEDKRTKMLERVRALLAKAADRAVGPEEAEAFRTKADELMTAYAIDQWMIDQAQDATSSRPKPEVRDFDDSWWYKRTPYRNAFWALFCSTARHCRCVVASRGSGYKIQPVIGIPSDLDYFDLLFTHLMLQLQRSMDPDYDPALSLGENQYKMYAAGLGWPGVGLKCWRAGALDVPKNAQRRGTWGQEDETPVEKTTPWRDLSSATQQLLIDRCIRGGRKYAADNGLPKLSAHPQVFQRSYSEGFVREVSARLATMRRNRSEGPAANTGSMELAIRDIRQAALDLYNELWPEPEPDPNAKESTAVARELATDWNAYQAGKEAGSKAEIVSAPSERLDNKKEIGS